MRDNYPNRTIPAYGISYERSFWSRFLDLSKKVAVFWMDGPDDVRLVGYYDTVSDGNAAALENADDSGTTPFVDVNWFHSDFTHEQIGAISHRDATVDMPSWVDAIPLGN